MTASAYAPKMETTPHLSLVPPVAPSVPRIVGTPQQEAFWLEIETGKTHMTFDALAGTGKSFSICHGGRVALRKYPNLRVGYCAYNRSIADELRSKIPAGAEADTFHSYGKRAIADHLGRQPDVQDGKTGILLKQLLLPEEFDARKRVPKPLLKAVSGIVSMCKSYLLDGTPSEIDFIVKRHEIELAPNRAKAEKGVSISPQQIAADAAFKARVYELVPKVLERSKEMISTIDYDDMLWLPIVLDLPTIPVFHLLFVDESQDLNRARQELAFRMCHRKGRIVCVGDRNQAIYGFTGADAQSMATMAERMKATERGFKGMPLTVSFRCPKAAAVEAQKIVPTFEVLPDAIEGSVEHISEKDAPTHMQPGHMVLCRCNAPLVKMAHQLLRAKKKALLKGKDLSKPIKELMDTLGENDVKAMGDALKSYRAIEVDRLNDANKSPQVIAAFEDKCETLEVLMEGCSNRAQVESKIDQIFEKQDPEGAVILMTAHGSKGLEADVVWLLKPGLMPHPSVLKSGDEDQLQQEMNLRYVALTRTKNRLIFIDEVGGEPTKSMDEAPKDMPSHVPTPEPQSTILCAPVVASVPVKTEIRTGDWDAIRAHLQAACDAAPYDTDLRFFQGLEMALGAIPRG
ncbi:ATP-dependent helicase [bacterium]|nr:MAG: ATP-dependent helicase [bacterium]